MNQTEETVDYLQLIRCVQEDDKTGDEKEKDDIFWKNCGENCDYTAVSAQWDRMVNKHGQER